MGSELHPSDRRRLVTRLIVLGSPIEIKRACLFPGDVLLTELDHDQLGRLIVRHLARLAAWFTEHDVDENRNHLGADQLVDAAGDGTNFRLTHPDMDVARSLVHRRHGGRIRDLEGLLRSSLD